MDVACLVRERLLSDVFFCQWVEQVVVQDFRNLLSQQGCVGQQQRHMYFFLECVFVGRGFQLLEKGN